MIRIRESANGVHAGEIFGGWKVLGPAFSVGSGMWAVVAQCRCGRVSVVRTKHLAAGDSTQCQRCNTSQIHITHGGARLANGGRERLYTVWANMRDRCRNPKNKKYPRYGGRGIQICEQWNDYAVFRAWAIANGHSEELELDRKDNNGNYEPDNCQWLTKSENSRKRREEEKAEGINHGNRAWAKRSRVKS